MKTPLPISKGSRGTCSRLRSGVSSRAASSFTGRNAESRPRASARFASPSIHAPSADGGIMQSELR